MADKKISELTAGGSLQDTDLIPIARSGSTLSVLWSAVTGLFAPLTRSINTGTGLQGGGDLSADRTISMVDVGPGVTGPIGDATHVPQVTINARGQVTALASVAIAFTPTIDVVVNGLGPSAFWKLNETSGVIAHDSSGNGNDLPVPTGKTAATWGETVGPAPTGATSALFDVTGPTMFYLSSYAALVNDFSAAGWWRRPNGTAIKALVGQGIAIQLNSNGWELVINKAGSGNDNKAELFIGSSSGPTSIVSDNALTVDTWYHIGFTRVNGLFTLYVNGSAQASTSSATYAGAGGIWLGHDGTGANGTSGTTTCDAYGSYVTVFGRGLSASEMAYLASARP